VQAVVGPPHWPWRPIGERDVTEAIDAIRTRGPQVIALSGHDSTPWTYDAFERAFGERYRTLRVGEELLIALACSVARQEWRPARGIRRGMLVERFCPSALAALARAAHGHAGRQ
jgi:hypothetical protein